KQFLRNKLSGLIKILPQNLYNKIAAGEVVGRPESVVKELIENSIDAGADEITVLIKDAGKTLIQVIDNGSGMREEDAVVAFQRHATSKIATYEDLENIQTLGFRGEALASIAAISQVELKTRTSDEDVGTLVKIEGNEVTEVSKTNTETGTSVAVKNIFYNTPGRRNFLKSNQTEFRHIYDTFIRQAISHPGTAFKFYNNDEIIFDLRKTSLQLRLKEIFGDAFADSLLAVKSDKEFIKLNGFISKPGFTKKSKQDQFFFLNNRFFMNKNLSFAVYSGYDDLIEKGDYPSFFLFIETDPKKVDVNVHPSKLEVKFEDESSVFGFIRKSVKDNLRSNDLTFDVSFGGNTGTGIESSSLEHRTPASGSSDTNFTYPGRNSESFAAKSTSIHSIFQASRNQFPDDKAGEDGNETELTDIPGGKDESPAGIFHHQKNDDERFNVWQFHYKYILCETANGLMIIDQHAAHERVLYEKAVLMLNSQASFSQQLLLPVKVKLTKIDFILAKNLAEELQSLGFSIIFGSGDVAEVTGIPSDVKPGDENKILQELIDQYKEYEVKLNLEKRDNLAKSFACRGAIKSGDRLHFAEMVNLIDMLFACGMPYVCPHGRPTVIRITTEELDKRFSRT
ncbi:MAG: DNA mismatch repair endonuclease MutL, partial [Ignavibacteria bacterium]|nr:DNA mismatch repair endonuclease MutL [Ignavibacteria bacterium]